MKHEIGKTIGNLHIQDYTEIKNGRRSYILQCTCGKQVRGTNDSVKRAEVTLKQQGVSGCMNCIRKARALNKCANDGSYRDIFVRYKKGAKTRKLDWGLTYEQAVSLFKGSCVYCGEEPKHTYSRSKYYKVPYNGIDRIDTTQGYFYDNCASSCRACNVSKHEMSVKDFLNHVKKIYDFQRLSREGVEPSGSKQEASY